MYMDIIGHVTAATGTQPTLAAAFGNTKFTSTLNFFGICGIFLQHRVRSLNSKTVRNDEYLRVRKNIREGCKSQN